MTIHTYLPQDRLRAIANNTTLPDRTSGSVLFADISGFTALTEALQKAHGARRGSEELSKHLGVVYTSLISEIEKYGGSVISFAGDSMLCWFDSGTGIQRTEIRAVNAAFGMQAGMKLFEQINIGNSHVILTLKTMITTGPVRRFVAGDPEIMKLDVLAGDTVARTATAEHLAQKGEVLLDEATVKTLGDALQVREWRQEAGERFAIVGSWESGDGGQESPLPSISQMPPPDKLISWIHKPVFEREQYRQGGFLTEFRPCTALFIRFTGIDYDSDSAESELDLFIRTVQATANRYEGTLMDITIGDKGSYVYVTFGALSLHEDDSRRVVKTALELRNKTELQLQMGITQGLMRVGAYGGETRKVFGTLGDDINLAARLMTTARENEILLSGNVHNAVSEQFTFEPRPPLPMKGKAEPLPVFAVTGESQKRAVRLQEPNYSLPMVGRQAELSLIEAKLDLARKGKSQIIGIVAEAGLGKSRLVAEVIRSARRKGFVGFGGACQSDGIHTPYQAWKSIWQAFFEVDPDSSLKKQMRNIEGEIEDRAPSRVDAMPLLNVVLDLHIPENDFTQNLEPKIRQSALHALLEDCLKAQSEDGPTLIVIEDMHWIDALSNELLEQLTQSLAGHAVCFVLAYRPPQMERLQTPSIEALDQFTKIELHELTATEAESAVRAKLAQLYPARGGALSSSLVEALMARSQGNPFYLEELLNYVRDRGLDPSDIQNIELPDSLHTLILSRIDQLSDQEKTTLRAASIVGRLFHAHWLTGYYPELGSFPQVKAALDALEALDITPLDSPEPELTYLFKHIVTHEVTYASLPFATRANLHEQLAKYLENADAPIETIAFHYGRSANQAKQMEYLRKAGETSQKNYANLAALEYYGQLLSLLNNPREKIQIHLKRGDVLNYIGRWDEAEGEYRAAMDSVKDDPALIARLQTEIGCIYRLRGEYDLALDILGSARQAYTTLNDKKWLERVKVEIGIVLYRLNEFEKARVIFNEHLTLPLHEQDKKLVIKVLITLGAMETIQGNFQEALNYYEQCLIFYRELGDKAGLAIVYGNIGNIAYQQGDFDTASAQYQKGLELVRETGNKPYSAMIIGNIGNIALARNNFAQAESLYTESLQLYREMGGKMDIARLLVNLGLGKLLDPQGNLQTARTFIKESHDICIEIGDKGIRAYALLGLGLIGLKESSLDAKENILNSLRLRTEVGEPYTQISSLIGVAGLVLQEGNPQFASQLLGAVQTALKELNTVVEADVRPVHEQTQSKAREVLGDARFQSAWEEGSKWSLEETVKRVLEQG